MGTLWNVHKNYEQNRWKRAALTESNPHWKHVQLTAGNADQTLKLIKYIITPVIQRPNSPYQGVRHSIIPEQTPQDSPRDTVERLLQVYKTHVANLGELPCTCILFHDATMFSLGNRSGLQAGVPAQDPYTFTPEPRLCGFCSAVGENVWQWFTKQWQVKTDYHSYDLLLISLTCLYLWYGAELLNSTTLPGGTSK